MSSPNLANYLRMFRKRFGLTQEEVAFLLGCQTGGHVSRYEHFRRKPSFRTALACEAIFHTPIRQLFSGEYRKVEKAVRQRAKRLAKQFRADKRPGQPSSRKLSFLIAIAAEAGSQS